MEYTNIFSDALYKGYSLYVDVNDTEINWEETISNKERIELQKQRETQITVLLS